MNKLNIPETKASLWGWMLISLILLSLVSIWVVSIPDIIVAIRKYLDNHKKTLAEREESKTEKLSNRIDVFRFRLEQYSEKKGKKRKLTDVPDIEF